MSLLLYIMTIINAYKHSVTEKSPISRPNYYLKIYKFDLPYKVVYITLTMFKFFIFLNNRT